MNPLIYFLLQTQTGGMFFSPHSVVYKLECFKKVLKVLHSSITFASYSKLCCKHTPSVCVCVFYCIIIGFWSLPCYNSQILNSENANYDPIMLIILSKFICHPFCIQKLFVGHSLQYFYITNVLQYLAHIRSINFHRIFYGKQWFSSFWSYFRSLWHNFEKELTWTFSNVCRQKYDNFVY